LRSLAAVRVLRCALLFAGLEPDPHLDVLVGEVVVQPLLETLDLGDDGADARRAAHRNLRVRAGLARAAVALEPREERASAADRIGAVVEPHELPPARLAERDGDLADVAVGPGPLAWVLVL
jgi:hypothetical protein